MLPPIQDLYSSTVPKPDPLTQTQESIVKVCDDIKALLLMKNKAYKNSATNPKRIFSKAGPVEQILVRIDDKLSRIENTGVGDVNGENSLDDLIGYLILLKVALKNVA
jgi:hypothetical protein